MLMFVYPYRQESSFLAKSIPSFDKDTHAFFVGRNLRFSRADPNGQPSPLWCVLLSPQGLATLRGPHVQINADCVIEP